MRKKRKRKQKQTNNTKEHEEINTHGEELKDVHRRRRKALVLAVRGDGDRHVPQVLGKQDEQSHRPVAEETGGR